MTLQVALGLIIALLVYNVILTMCAIIWAREGARNAGQLAVHERIIEEGKTISVQGRK